MITRTIPFRVDKPTTHLYDETFNINDHIERLNVAKLVAKSADGESIEWAVTDTVRMRSPDGPYMIHVISCKYNGVHHVVGSVDDEKFIVYLHDGYVSLEGEMTILNSSISPGMLDPDAK